jgi:hypothetical protein
VYPRKPRNSALAWRRANEGDGAPGLENICEKVGGRGVSGFVLEQHWPVVALLQHGLSLFEGRGMIKPRQQAAPMAVEDLANEEEILLLVSY